MTDLSLTPVTPQPLTTQQPRSLAVTDGSTSVEHVTEVSFDGATVTDEGSGVAGVAVSGGSQPDYYGGDALSWLIATDSSPGDAAFGADGTTYVCCIGANNVKAYSAGPVKTWTGVEISVGTSPWRAASLSDGTVLIVNRDDGTVSVIVDDAVADTLTVGSYPTGIAVASDDTVYVSNYGDDTLSVIAEGSVTDTVSVGSGPNDLAVAGDGTVYLANNGDATVSVVVDGAVTATVDVGTEPTCVTVTSDGTAYVGWRDEGGQYVLGRISSGSVVGTVSLPLGATAWRLAHAEDDTIYCADNTNQAVYVVRDNEVISRIRTESAVQLNNVVVGPDGYVYLPGAADLAVGVIVWSPAFKALP